MIILRRTDCFILIWACSAVLTERYNCHVQIIAVFKQNLNKTTAQFSLCHAMLFSKRCLWSCMVGLIQLTKPAKMVYLTRHGPMGIKGRRGSTVCYEACNTSGVATICPTHPCNKNRTFLWNLWTQSRQSQDTTRQITSSAITTKGFAQNLNSQ